MYGCHPPSKMITSVVTFSPFCFWNFSSSKLWVSGPAALGSSLEMQSLRPGPRPTDSEPASNKVPSRFPCTSTFRKHCSTCHFSITLSWGLHPAVTLRLEFLVSFPILKRKDVHTYRNSFPHLYMMSFILPGLRQERKWQITSKRYIFLRLTS